MGVKSLPSKAEAVKRFPKPSTPKQLEEFKEMVVYYHRFLPLYAVLKGAPKNYNGDPPRGSVHSSQKLISKRH